MKAPPPSSNGGYQQANSAAEGERKSINSELWHACAGPLVSLPPAGSLVVYFPQGHSEQVAASMQKDTNGIPSYPNLPSKLICMLHNVTLHADPETDEVYAQMTLQPVTKYDQEALLVSDMGLKQNRQPTEFFCKTLTASDTSTHGGFSVPRRAAEKIFPPLDFTMQPPARELVAKDLHDQTWTFRHIFRGQPKRHLLTTGWSVFVSSKRLFAGDSVLFIRDDKSQFLLGIRRANRQQPALASSVISSDSMHIGILAAAAHAAANNSPFTIFYNPRTSPSEFVIPLAKYNKAIYTQASLGMRFRMMFETEESGVRRYMGTITAISDLDPVRWKDSQWRNLQVGWDESTAGERPDRVSIWEIEPVVTPFYICPPPFFRPKFAKQPGLPDDESDMENVLKRGVPWLDDFNFKDASSSVFPGLSLVQWMSMQQQNNRFSGAAQSGIFGPVGSSTLLHGNLGTDDPSKLLNFQTSTLPTSGLQFNKTTFQQNQQAVQPLQQSQQWSQQQQLQQMFQSSMNSQQQQQLQQQKNHQQQQLTLEQQQQQQQMLQQSSFVNNNTPNQIGSQGSQHTLSSSHIQQQQSPAINAQTQHNTHPNGRNSFQPNTSLTPELQYQQQQKDQTSLAQQKPQQRTQYQHVERQLSSQSQSPHAQSIMQQQSLSEQHLQLLQRLQQQQQQQQQQLLSPSVSTRLETQVQHKQQLPSSQHQQQQQQQISGNSFSNQSHMQLPQFNIHQFQGQQKPIRTHSGFTDGDAPSCSTSPSTNNSQVSPSTFIGRNQQRQYDTVAHPATNLAHELENKPQVRVKHDFHSSKGSEQQKYEGFVSDQLEVSSSATSYSGNGNGIQHSMSLPVFPLEAELQSHSGNNNPFAANVDSLTPDALLSRGFDSGKDIQNLLANYGGTPRNMETDMSAAAITSQTFGVPNMSFKPAGCTNDVPINEGGVLGGGMWSGQTQRMRTYTKVQKRGSVGRTIDVSRYKGYDELRQDLARMFGIEGQLEDCQRSEWKLVYVDHENDILLVGDDPWDEFVTCVQSIKIQSAAEVQQMGFDGDQEVGGGNMAVAGQASSGTDNGNEWSTL